MVADLVPLYALYALLFAAHGLSTRQISGLFAIWSAVSVVVEVPCGTLADRFSRRGALAAAGVLQAAGYVLWIVAPGYAGFAVGFGLWGLATALVSGSFEALLYDGLAGTGGETQYPRVLGQVTAVGLIAQLPAAGAATVLFSVGGYPLVAWVSVGTCLSAAALAARLPEPSRAGAADVGPGSESYLTILRSGLAEAAARPALRNTVLGVALLSGVDVIDEYFPILAHDWGVPTRVVPLVIVGIPLAGAAGAALAAAAGRSSPGMLAAMLVGAGLTLGVAGVLARPLGLVAVGVFYAFYQLVLVVAGARLQDRIRGPARATVTSVAGLGTELSGLLLFATWALGELLLVAACVLVLAGTLPRWLREPPDEATGEPFVRP